LHKLRSQICYKKVKDKIMERRCCKGFAEKIIYIKLS